MLKKKTPKQAAKTFNAVIAASVKGNPKPKATRKDFYKSIPMSEVKLDEVGSFDIILSEGKLTTKKPKKKTAKKKGKK